MRIAFDLLYLLGLIALSPKIAYRILRQNRYRSGWKERFGSISRRRPDKPCIWIHAVSVGEVNATRTLIAQLQARLPDYEIAISATTDTGIARAKALYGDNMSVFFFPFDFSPVMKKAVANINPSICLLMELEIWPNLAQIAAERNIPLVVVNGRISDRSFPRYLKLRRFVRPMFSRLALALAQTQEYAERFKALGCDHDKVIVTCSLKYDTAQVADSVEGADSLAAQLNLGPEPLWVAGGTGPDEEKIILNTYRTLKQDTCFAPLRLAIVPRKPERFDEVASLIEESGFDYMRYSTLKNENRTADGKPAVILGDTMGDLRKFYSLATVVFVGRTLTPLGGSDMMEPAALGKCTLFGPHTFNFKQTVDALLSANGAIQVQDADELLTAMQKCLTDPHYARQIAAAGQNVIRQNQGATKKSVDAIVSVLAARA
ncbi:MAG TPA: 3-deoxy-D-manno-octulosonic acid transferase [Anaerohalosphaeraceae bacterium]|nr:3-deoxy-D-manno-octulosonic acid transferase [Anaerohalosphaeraceae bacterium]HRT51116.1 3-deoxy-D-manno-octulosonic acid transferase [Anaerohalosphaeraceae bacterium]HRT87131.1 3-deoxy-D-manno-octulosonic acid transferase [Anaerohalosphaeraceae bacterium]